MTVAIDTLVRPKDLADAGDLSAALATTFIIVDQAGWTIPRRESVQALFTVAMGAGYAATVSGLTVGGPAATRIVDGGLGFFGLPIVQGPIVVTGSRASGAALASLLAALAAAVGYGLINDQTTA